VSQTRQRAPPSNQLFEDTSQPPTQAMYGGAPPPQGGGYMQPGNNFPGPNFLQDPVVANMAMQYGQTLAGQGKEMLEKNVSDFSL